MGIGDDLQKEETEIYPGGKKKNGAKGNNIGLTSLSLPLKEKKKSSPFSQLWRWEKNTLGLSSFWIEIRQEHGDFLLFSFLPSSL